MTLKNIPRRLCCTTLGEFQDHRYALLWTQCPLLEQPHGWNLWYKSHLCNKHFMWHPTWEKAIEYCNTVCMYEHIPVKVEVPNSWCPVPRHQFIQYEILYYIVASDHLECLFRLLHDANFVSLGDTLLHCCSFFCPCTLSKTGQRDAQHLQRPS